MWVHGADQRSIALEIHNPQRHSQLFQNKTPCPSIVSTSETKSPRRRQIQTPSRFAKGVGWKHGDGFPFKKRVG